MNHFELILFYLFKVNAQKKRGVFFEFDKNDSHATVIKHRLICPNTISLVATSGMTLLKYMWTQLCGWWWWWCVCMGIFDETFNTTLYITWTSWEINWWNNFDCRHWLQFRRKKTIFIHIIHFLIEEIFWFNVRKKTNVILRRGNRLHWKMSNWRNIMHCSH